MVQSLWKSFAGSQKVKQNYHHDPAILLLCIYPKEMKTHVHTHKKNLYKNVPSNIIHTSQKWKQPKHLSTVKWINKMFIHAMKYYELNYAIKRNEVLKHGTTWMILKNIMLSERNQSQKAMCLLYDSI